jgi:hypothetical protein
LGIENDALQNTERFLAEEPIGRTPFERTHDQTPFDRKFISPKGGLPILFSTKIVIYLKNRDRGSFDR